MRTQLIFSALAVLLLASLSACENIIGDCVETFGPEEEREYFLAGINGIGLSIPAKVTIRQGGEQAIRIRGRRSLLDALETRVRDSIWTVDIEGCVNNYEELSIDVTLPRYKYLGISGEGKFTSENLLTTPSLELKVSGAGDMELEMETEELQIAISGSSNMFLNGVATLVDYQVSGQSNLQSFGLDTKTTYIGISGSANADVKVEEFLEVTISGQGTVRYKGNPKRSVRISGEGSVEDAN